MLFRLRRLLKKDKRLLVSDASKHVLPVLKAFFKECIEDQKLRAECINVDIITENGKVCRKCFSALERYKKLRSSIKEGVMEALDTLISIEPNSR